MRKALVVVVSLGLVVLSAMPAFAHVTVSPASAARGSFVRLAFSVPNEQADASTTKIEIFVPDTVALAFASVRPVPGWTATVENRHLANPVKSDDQAESDVVSKITWSGGEIKPGEFQLFEVSVGPLPDSGDSIPFKAIQTYSNGDVVRWIELTPPGGEEPEHPAPTLELTATSADSNQSAAKDTTDTDDNATLALGAAAAALVISLVAAGLAIGARRTKRAPES